jgi:hypothetical protein
MIISISNNPTQKYVYDNTIYDILREFEEICFVFHNKKRYVSLLGIIKNYVIIGDYRIDLPYLNKEVELVATDKILVYADNGDYVVYEKDEEGNLINEEVKDKEGNIIGYKNKIVDENRGVVGEFEFFLAIRNNAVSINNIIQNVVLRANLLKQFD